MFEFSTSEVGLVKYPYDEQLALILALLVHSLVFESVALDTTFRYSKQGVSQGASQKYSERCGQSCASGGIWLCVY